MEGSYRSFSILRMNANNLHSQSQGNRSPAQPQGVNRRAAQLCGSIRRPTDESRRSSMGSRRSSTDSNPSNHKLWGQDSGQSTGTGAASSFFALSSSFVATVTGAGQDGQGNGNSTWTPQRIAPRRGRPRGHGQSATCSNADTQEPQQWSASDRAERVASDARLNSLLHSEVKRVGVVTAAGYRAIHHKFLYSEEVEEEMKRSRSRRGAKASPLTRSQRLGGLVLSAFSSTGTSSRDLPGGGTNNTTKLAKSQTNPRRASYDASMDLWDDDELLDESNRTAETDQVNLAPRKSSQLDDMLADTRDVQEQEEELVREERRKIESFLESIDNRGRDDDSFRRSHNRDDNASHGSSYLSIHGSACGSTDSGVSSNDAVASSKNSTAHSVASNYARKVSDESRASLILQDVFDGMEGSRRFSNPMSDVEDVLAKKSLKKSAQSSDGGMTAITAMLSRHNTLSAEFLDVNFDPVDFQGKQDGGDESGGPQRKTSLQHSRRTSITSMQSCSSKSCHDECGWLPWPEKNDDNDDLSIDIDCHQQHDDSGMDDDDESFLPFPTVPRNEMARAA